MIASLVWAGAGLVLLPSLATGRRRLGWLAAHRWPQAGPVVDGEPMAGRGFPLRSVTGRPVLLAPVLALGGWPAGPVPALLAGLVGLVLGYCWRRLRAERALNAETVALADAVAAMVAEQAAGATLGAALSRAAAGAGRFQLGLQRAGRLAALGRPPAAALAGEPALNRVAVAVALIDRSGVAASDVLHRTHADLQCRRRIRRSITEATAGARSSAMLLATLPVVGLAMGAVLGAHPQRVLLHTTAGLAALSSGVVLNLIGLCWTLWLTTPGLS
jgi:tight adherence protein B